MTLADFVVSNMPKSFKRPLPWFVLFMCMVIERCYRERKHGIFELPPRHWKSEILNVYAPAWWIMEGYIHSHSCTCCNSQALADKFSQASSRMVPLPKMIDRVSEWKLEADKESLDLNKAVGIGGQLTGFGFDEMRFDDLFKNGMEAKSETKRNSIIDGVVSAGLNRLTPDGIVLACQARLHQLDTIGFLTTETDMRFLRLHLPAQNLTGDKAWFEDGYEGDVEVICA